MQETFLAQLQAAQREIGILKQAVLSPVALTASRQEQLARDMEALQAEMESKAQAAVTRSHDIVSASEETTRRIVDAARGDSGRLASERLAVGDPGAGQGQGANPFPTAGAIAQLEARLQADISLEEHARTQSSLDTILAAVKATMTEATVESSRVLQVGAGGVFK